MTSQFKIQYPDSLRTIYISAVETCDVNWFVNQYIDSRFLHSNIHAKNEVVMILKDYPWQPPVRLYELNAWLDHNMMSIALVNPGIGSLRLVVNNERPLLVR